MHANSVSLQEFCGETLLCVSTLWDLEELAPVIYRQVSLTALQCWSCVAERQREITLVLLSAESNNDAAALLMLCEMLIAEIKTAEWSVSN
ncbi:hypothetical protein [Planctomicrobium piriforme]|uniref:Uncharacterized protein n=1 Tax=Planctomicrobium piriforme TaxID=1576369 RepID=A0A1I3SB23_9PLAN|nr:hypothetical protein [Planctomicrobium piriforme]SFJ55172.1 hypothetical protein SAMN05421753_12362 [Planctomicrobium piriforme]